MGLINSKSISAPTQMTLAEALIPRITVEDFYKDNSIEYPVTITKFLNLAKKDQFSYVYDSEKGIQFSTFEEHASTILHQWKSKIIENPTIDNFLMLGRGPSGFYFFCATKSVVLLVSCPTNTRNAHRSVLSAAPAGLNILLRDLNQGSDLLKCIQDNDSETYPTKRILIVDDLMVTGGSIRSGWTILGKSDANWHSEQDPLHYIQSFIRKHS